MQRRAAAQAQLADLLTQSWLTTTLRRPPAVGTRPAFARFRRAQCSWRSRPINSQARAGAAAPDQPPGDSFADTHVLGTCESCTCFRSPWRDAPARAGAASARTVSHVNADDRASPPRPSARVVRARHHGAKRATCLSTCRRDPIGQVGFELAEIASLARAMRQPTPCHSSLLTPRESAHRSPSLSPSPVFR